MKSTTSREVKPTVAPSWDWELRLYVAGQSPKSLQALAKLLRICEEHLEARVRTPTSSSFPSGHTLAAFATAVVLPDSNPEMAAYVGFAGAVAASRVHLRAHHPSDVLGGAAIGAALGLLLRPVANLLAPGSRSGSRRRRTAKGMGPEGYVLKKL